MTDNQNSTLKNYAANRPYGDLERAIMAALAEIDELRKKVQLLETMSKSPEYLAVDWNRVRQENETLKANHDNAHKENNRLRLEALDFRKEIDSLYAHVAGRENRIEGLVALNKTLNRDTEEMADILVAHKRTIADLKQKLAAPPETLAITEIHNRLAKLEANAKLATDKAKNEAVVSDARFSLFNDLVKRVEAFSVAWNGTLTDGRTVSRRIDELERDVKSIGDEVVTLMENKSIKWWLEHDSKSYD
jgi:chromosome segregation ATPase